jgi:hypothetical protein
MASASPEYLPFLTEIVSSDPSIVSHRLFQTSDVIRGDWHEDAAKTGKGIIFSPGKFYYEGDIVDCRASGKGKILWESRMSYEGSVVNNQANGLGTLKFPEDETALSG